MSRVLSKNSVLLRLSIYPIIRSRFCLPSCARFLRKWFSLRRRPARILPKAQVGAVLPAGLTVPTLGSGVSYPSPRDAESAVSSGWR